MGMQQISLTRPDDWHLHLRDGDAMRDALADSARVFSRAIIMPNLKPPVTTTAAAQAYHERICRALPNGSRFQPLMTLYLTDNTDPAEIHRAWQSGLVYAAKLYPAGATTHSDSGVTRMEAIHPALEAMAGIGMPLLVHGEVTRADVDIFDREAVFTDEVLAPLQERLPELRIVLEHVTTEQGVEFVKAAGPRVAATITAHHLLYNRNHLLVGGIRPHLYCLPVLKRDRHQRALLRAATSGDPSFFLGSDSAPHSRDSKENACGCAGCYTAHAALELYAEAFAGENALEHLEGFASHHGPDFYGLPRNRERIVMEQRPWTVAETRPFGHETLVPLRAGETVQWQIRGDH